MRLTLAILLLLLGSSWPAIAQHKGDQDIKGPAGTTLLIIRHAEKPANKATGGPGLTPAGEARAKGYADYFRNFTLEGMPVRIDALVATADTANSARPRLTLEPLSNAIGAKIQQPFVDDDVAGLAHWLANGKPNHTVLIAWHHERIPKLLTELGADPNSLLPGGIWPPQTYDWVIVLRYDGNGRISLSERIVEPTKLASQ